MSQQGYLLAGIATLMAALVVVLVFALVRFVAAARETRHSLSERGMETALLSAALEDAIGRLKAQERAMTARAEASEHLSDQIIASSTAGLLVLDLTGHVRVVNPAARRLLGLGYGPLTHVVGDVLGADSPVARAIEECLRTGQPIVGRSLEVSGPGRTTTHVSATVSRLIDQSDATTGVICLLTDLTQIIDLEEQLRLKETLARLGELTAGLAHEFRNGLATIHGYARLIDLDAMAPTQQTYLAGIRAETDELGKIVTNFLNFARPTQLALTSVSVEQLAERVAEEVRGEAERLGGSVTVAGTWALVDGDEVLLRQAISNLARNALEACVNAGIAPEIAIGSHADNRTRTLRLHVTDNGPGIEPSNRERVFRPFFTTKQRGTGLGLALVQKIIVTHNGRVQALTGPDARGTTMLVTLPLSA